MPLSPLDLSLNTFQDLTGNWVRSGLTALGIFMGVTAINATLNIRSISNNVLQEQIAARDNPYVTPQNTSYDKPPVEWSDEVIAGLERSVPGIASISQVKRLFTVQQVQHLGKVASEVQPFAVSENFQQTTGRKVLQGRFFEPGDFTDYHPVAIIDEVLVSQLFANENPLGAGIFVSGTRLTVVGIIESKQRAEGEEPKGTLWVPDTFGTVLQSSAFDSFARTIQISIDNLSQYETVQKGITDYLQQQFPGYNIVVSGNVEDLYRQEQQQRSSIRVLIGVGLLALVIGGVGIANITIAAVMERTREIGLRRAIGATDVEVMAQFIAEAALLSLLGGATAVVTVHFLTKAVTTTVFDAPYEFSTRDAAISMGAAFAVGVGSSFLPALRVTQIDIIQALRGD
ncbi:MAG: FtsX-like permease family protein [Leptolyngbyaceae cyanobacterium SM2_3_12]|nr:FtsX-like permease family protein [Leptolyngbyaceae cyanobacterium SM2_3_12]